MNALRPLLSGIVDYAGLFPPAALDMTAAVRSYEQYRHDPDAWMLGRFVVPAARLDEFAAERSSVVDDDAWPIAALLGADVAADMATIDAFNDAHSARAVVDTVEGKLPSPAAIRGAAELVAGRFSLFAEIPIDRDPAPLVAGIAQAGVNAKVRTGGVTPDAFPVASDIVRFMRACRAAGVAFKATAGLHHPLRAEHRLTYASDAPRGMMYGYLNVFLTAALLDELGDDDAVALLEERDPSAIAVERDVLRWRTFELRTDELAAARDSFAASFGSCSFREPVDELRALRLLP